MKEISGLPVKLTSRGLIFGKNLTRPSFEKKDYKKHREFFKSRGLAKNKVLYYIYRNVAFLKDAPLFKKEGLRYDLTLIFGGGVGQEPVRTIGHFHKGKLPEVYQVIYGNAIFYFQDSQNKKSYFIEKRGGEKVFIPSGFGHITINPSSQKPLLIANIFTSRPKSSNYLFFKRNHGPAWYPTTKKGEITLEKNLNYKKFSKVSKKLPFQPKIALGKTPLYKDFVKNPEKFSFLKI
ncbi:hypothetical protein A2108_00210 [Candidatus Wolfebacteria bacterium GWA1_42_9]|nr:MAG: hypothetical protein A2108_00210 [Candidatus Wolfebacteria bacterium GWA1_42_9]